MDDPEASICNRLEHMIVDESAEPIDLPLPLLKSITYNFSDDLQIGSGGFAVVYMGLLQNGKVAVKKLFLTQELHETKFCQEVDCMMRVKHKNIVRFMGYCSDTQGKVHKFHGKNVMKEERQRFLCFEFMPQGSLDKYINDASKGFEWITRYQIIKGICKGLHYLHQQKIIHLDLKPANILLDDNMVPKIADFGLSKCFDENQTRAMTTNVFGSNGYMSPESYGGVITFKSDIYSLGIIVIEILTGQKGYPHIENVLESWMIRYRMSQGDTQLEPIRVCAEIGIDCIDFNPTKRPDTRRIIERLDEMERLYGITIADACTSSGTGAGISSVSKLVDQMQSMDIPAAPSPLQRITSSVPKGLGETSTEILDIYPLELQFPWEPNKIIQCPLTLTNRTDNDVDVWIIPTDRSFPDLWHCKPKDPSSPLLLSIEPHCTQVFDIEMNDQPQWRLQNTSMFEVMMVVGLRRTSARMLTIDSNFLKRVEERGGQVHRAMLKATICYAASCQRLNFEHKFIARPKSLGDIKSIDVHPKEPWILVIATSSIDSGSRNGIYILNYQTQEILMMLQSENKHLVCSAKFLAQEQCFAIGDGDGWVHIHADNTQDVLTKFKAHGDNQSVDLMAVHPTYPFLLTASTHCTKIKLWDWSQNWKCIRIFDQRQKLSTITLNPLDTDTFACISASSIKVWEIRSSDPITTLEGPRVKACFFRRDSQRNYMVTCPRWGHGYLHIWDMQTMKIVHKVFLGISSDPTLPTITARLSKAFYLWDARTYRMEEAFQLTHKHVTGGILNGSKDLPRLVVGCQRGIAILKCNFIPLATYICVAGIPY